MNHILPAYPLITLDPYLSLWSFAEKLNGDEIRHWTGTKKPIRGFLSIDRKRYCFLGKGNEKIPQIDHRVTPMRNIYVFENASVRLEICFFSPLLPDNPIICSRPVSYIDYSCRIVDGKKHDVQIVFEFDESLCYDTKRDSDLRSEILSHPELTIAYMGKTRQPILEVSGDNRRINWGYLFVAAGKAKSSVRFSEEKHLSLELTCTLIPEEKDFIMIGYDDIASVNYFGDILKGYWTKKYETIVEALEEAYRDHDEQHENCLSFDEDLLLKAENSGGEEMKSIVTASYRQCICAHKMVADRSGELLFISKENGSNGCAATVDISYPSQPLFLLYNPELVLGMIRPILRIARMKVWPYDFAPHDAGRFPILHGNVYGLKRKEKNGDGFPPHYFHSSDDELYDLKMQMPVEESGNMLILLAAVCLKTKDTAPIRENLDLLNRWVQYLVRCGLNPGEQLCTDDFAGHLAHNANLSLKAILGIEAYAEMNRMIGKEKEYEKFHDLAKTYAEEWVKKSDDGDHTVLAFGMEDSWSLKYNLIWDKYFGSGLFPKELSEKECRFYAEKSLKYGVPLDSRKDYTKADWICWVSALTTDRNLRRELLGPIARYLGESSSRVPFGDWYDARGGEAIMFKARSVVGGCFMPILIDEIEKGG